MPSFSPARCRFATVGLTNVDQITFTGDGSIFWITNRGAVDLWFRVDGTDPAAEADGSHLVLTMSTRTLPDPTGNKDIRVTAGSSACSYGVELM